MARQPTVRCRTHGINAIVAINDFINELNRYEIRYHRHDLLGDSTLNIGMIQGGVGANVVPDQCKLTIDIRTVPGQNHQELISEINELLQKVANRMNVTYEMCDNKRYGVYLYPTRASICPISN